MSERHFRRLRDAYAEGGAEAIVDRRRGKRPANKAPQKRKDWIVEQYVTRYSDCSPKHFHEELKKRGFDYGSTWTKSVLYLRGVLKPATKRGAHRKKRVRSPLPGMLVFQDGSTHDWFLGRRAPCDLIVTLDDATSEIVSAFFVEQERTMSSFVGLPEVGGKVDRQRLAEVGRALAQLGVEHIPSYAPEARGRMERVFGTLQGRLPPLMRLAQIDDIEAANHWLREIYIAEHNDRFAVVAAEEGSAFIAFVGDLDNVLCVQAERVVSNDNTVRYDGRVLQIPEQKDPRHYVKASVRVHEYPDGRLAVFHGPRLLARYEAGGAR